jgi:hypothetical protein
MELNIKESLESVKIYGRYLSEFLLPDQIDLLAKSLQKDIEQKLTLTDVVGQSEQLHTEVFNLANKLAINGYGNEAVKMHVICNGM